MSARRLVRSTMALALLANLAGCAAALNPNAPRSVGRGTYRAILHTVPETLNRFGYAVTNQRETPNTISFETAWEHREPFDDEAAQGAEVCRTRVTVEARKGGGEMYTVTLRVENAARGPSPDGEWQQMPATTMFQEHVRQMVVAMQNEIDAGVRIY